MKKIFIIFISLVCAINLFGQNVLDEINEKYKDFSNGDVLISHDYTYKTGNFAISKKPYSTELVGVYYNVSDKNIKDLRKYKNPIRIHGVCYVKFNLENGIIKKGDPITSSNTPGEAMKATDSGMIIGVALEDSDKTTGLLKIKLMIQYVR